MTAPANQTAIVLSGGGAYGAFAIGVLKVLFAGRSPATGYEPLSADIYTGTSVGAFNAAVMVEQGAQPSLESVLRLENIWLELVADRPGRCGNGIFRIRGNPADLVDAGCLSEPVTMATRFASDSVAIGNYLAGRTANFLASSSSSLEDRALAFVNVGSLVDSAPYDNLLRRLVNEESVRQSPKRLHITATNWIQGTARYFCNPDFHDGYGIKAIMASTAIPGVFPPVRIDRDIYVDGGVVQNTPLNAAIEFGGTNLHVIYLDPSPSRIRLRADANTVETMLRVYFVMLATKIAEDVETARWINAGLDAVTQHAKAQTISDEQLQDFIRVAGQFVQSGKGKYKRLTVHRYFPENILGGDLGMLNFGIDAVARMITEGERVALIHDCSENGCIV
jgi:predicted acylesterase/phospholipase RssA